MFRSGEGLTSSNKDNSDNLSGEKKNAMKHSLGPIRDNTRKNFISNLVLVVVLVFESKGL